MTAPFHELVRSLSVEAAKTKPTKFHEMLARLSKENRLKRLYTQNIDGLETSMPPLGTEIPLNVKGRWPITIQLHGSITKMVCQKCRSTRDLMPERFLEADPPECDACSEYDGVRQSAGQRSHGVGRMRPRIVLYNEHNPDEEAITSVMNADVKSRPRVLIVAGTSLKIPGVRRLVKSLCTVIRGRKDGVTMFINNEPPVGKEFENCFDLIVQGTTDEVADLAKLKHWEDSTPYEMLPDPVFDTKHTSDQESETESQKTISVVIESTPKKRPHSETGLFTPTSSNEEEPSIKKLANPASRGRNLNDVLKASKTTGPAKPHKKATSTASKKKGSKAEPAKSAKITTFSRVTKSAQPAAGTAKKTANGKPMHPLPAVAARNNGLLFPNLAKKAGVDAPAKVEGGSVPEVLPELLSASSS